MSYTGVAAFLARCSEVEQRQPVAQSASKPKKSPQQKKKKRKKKKKKMKRKKIVVSGDGKSDSNPNNTVFVGRLSYEVTEVELATEFARFGQVRKVEMLHGYAFVEFVENAGFQRAFKEADGMVLRGRAVVVDKQRGSVEPGWLPRKQGGGLGSRRVGTPSENRRIEGREPCTTPGTNSTHGRAVKRSVVFHAHHFCI
jgi:U1 small nuclear ribonucleoprotein